MAGADRNRIRLEVEKELRDKTPQDPDLKRQAKEFAEDVRDFARGKALEDMDRGYATGHFVESIQVRRIKRWWRKTMPNYEVYSTDPDLADMLEEGTGRDKPDSRSPWGPNTPTPAYFTFTKTAAHFAGTPDGHGGDAIEEG